MRLAGLIAEKSNQYFHIDTTYYHISEGRKVCITFIMDNYSKMILGFAVNEKLCFDLIKGAFTNALSTVLSHKDINKSYLVCDGGKENNNKQIEGFISEITLPKLTKLIALKDIPFSNSPIEAIHKIMKGRYIRNRKFQTTEGLIKFLSEAVYDYNYLRPHYKHFPSTLSEAYFGNNISFNIAKRLSKAMSKRIKNN